MTTESGRKLSSELFTISHSTVGSMYPDFDRESTQRPPLRLIATFTSFDSNSVAGEPVEKTVVERTKSAPINVNTSHRETNSTSALKHERTSSIDISLAPVATGATQGAASESIGRTPSPVPPSKAADETANEDTCEWTSIDISNIDTSIVSTKRESREANETITPSPLTKKDYLTIACLCLGHFGLGTAYAVMAPFFPSESEAKGLTATFYGIVFSVFELGQFIFAPLTGFLIPQVGTKFALVIGLFICGWCTTIFGLLQWSPPRWTFFGLSLTLRLFSSLGASAYSCATSTLIATTFADRVSTLFSMIEAFFGVGLIVGPSVGGVLYEHGGFSLPFFATGAEFFLVAMFAIFALRGETTKQNNRDTGEAGTKKASVFNLCKETGILVNMSITLVAFMNIGFNDTTLEHHVSEKINLSPSKIGLIFLVSGGIYALSTQMWGILIQKFKHTYAFVVAGFICGAVSFLLCGPAWPLPDKPSLLLIIVGQGFYGISLGPQLVGSFTQGLSEAVEAGYSDDITTPATMSSLYQSTCALGASIGPVVGGFLMDKLGYSKACSFMFLLQIAMIVLLCVYNLCCKRVISRAVSSDNQLEDSGTQK